MTHKQTLFGTDGIRGKAGDWPLDSHTLKLIAKYSCLHLKREGSEEPIIVIGYDTRQSCGEILAHLQEGFKAVSNAQIVSLGIVPTAAVAFYVKELRADFGVMISASHNPADDNGIKFFDLKGLKLSDEAQDIIEADVLTAMENDKTIDGEMSKKTPSMAASQDIKEYESSLLKTLPSANHPLQGLKVVLDCANGSGYEIAPKLLKSLAASVEVIGDDPNGRNINAGFGAVETQVLQEAVKKHGADIGLALDGDADRLVAVDEKGNLIEGDQIITAIATQLKSNGKLENDLVVTTVMSNMGMDDYLSEQGIDVIRTAVGDRYVTEAMIEKKVNLGGEQSGHIIIAEHGLAGDGLVAAVQVLMLLKETEKPASQVLRPFKAYTQRKENLTYDASASNPLEDKEIRDLITETEKELEDIPGRLLVRKSGTEPKIRILMEAKDKDKINTLFDRFLSDFKKLMA